jgi:N-acetylmuramic acid 6-phosphate etherase/N-acetylglucosamine-6-phosphate deacetylase
MSRPDSGADLEGLGTEQVRPELTGLDQLSVEELVALMCSDVRRVPAVLAAAQDAIARAVVGVVDRLERGGRLVYVGAGTAGRLGMLDAAEAGPTFNIAAGQVVGVLAGGADAFTVPVENAEDDGVSGAAAMASLAISPLDAVVGISASGRTPYVLAAVEAANAAGALSVGIACNLGTPLGAVAGFPIEMAVGAEVIAGSTRMNAGTAQKVVLNIISTASMVRLGKTYGNLMVDLRPTNAKLRDRAERIVAEIAGTATPEARAALEGSGWRPKIAATMLVGGLDAAEAELRLAQHRGRLRPTLASLAGVAGGARAAGAARAGGTRGAGWTRLGVAAALVEGSLVPGDVAVHGGEIVAVGIAGRGSGLAVPGLVDAQVNGYAGVDVLDADAERLLAMGDALLRDGVMAYQPTLITSELHEVERAARRIDEARRRRESGATILGIHLEGPFLAPGRRGVHPVELLREPDLALLGALLDVGGVTMVTLAPELPGALGLIALCRARDVAVSLGHSAATSLESERGFEAGATAVTHLFNAMEPMLARAPGLAGEAMARPGVVLQLIADGVHVADAMIRLAFAAAPGRCVLVSDAIAAAGTAATSVRLGDVPVVVDNGVARRPDGTIAGGVGKLRDGLSRIARLGVAVPDALAAVTRRPARLVGTTRYGDLRLGGPADLLVLDDDLEIARVVVGGREIEPTRVPPP